MRTIRRLLMVAVLGVGGIAAFNYGSAVDWPRVSRPAADARHYATRLANRAATKAGNVANKVGHKLRVRFERRGNS